MVDVWKWIKWAVKIIRAKYWINLFSLAVFMLCVMRYFSDNEDNYSMESFFWFMSILVTGIGSLILFFAPTTKDIDDVFEMIYDFFETKWTEGSRHISDWWHTKP